MKITIHQAIYGELNGAWDLLNTSLSNNSAAKKIRFQTDLQDRPPSGIIWQPVVRGFAVDGFYIITKTYADNSPNVRSGRVFSHSLIINNKELGIIENLKYLFSYFSESIDKSISLSPITYPLNCQKVAVIEDTIIPRFNKLIHGIAEAGAYQNTIVWIGQEYFDDVVCATWTKLSQSEREGFTFGINFNPKEVTKSNLTLITTPSTLENRWINTNYCVIKRHDSYQLTSFFELYLSGDVEAEKKLNIFIKDIEASPGEREDYSFLSKGVSAYEKIGSNIDFNQIYSLYQIVTEYSPNRKKGIVLKEKLLLKLCKLAEETGEKEIIALRNLKLTAFENSENALSKALLFWIKNNLLDVSTNKTNNFSKILELYNINSNNWWHNTLIEVTQLSRYLIKLKNESAQSR